MIYESVIKSMMNETTTFELPTELEIMKEYYENEISFLNYTLECKDALSTVTESTELAIIQEEFNNKYINKIKEIIKKFIDFCKNLAKTIKEKVKNNTVGLRHKLKVAEQYLLFKTHKTIVFTAVRSGYMYTFNSEFEDKVKILNKSMAALQNAMGRNDLDEYDIQDAYDVIKTLTIDTPDPNKYIEPVTIDKENAKAVIKNIKDNIQIAEHNQAYFAKTLANFTSAAESYSKYISGYEGKKTQEVIRCINLLLTKAEMLSNVYAATVSTYLALINKSLDSLLKKAKVKDEE